MVRGAQDLGDTGPDNTYGHGLIDAWAAFKILHNARGSAALSHR